VNSSIAISLLITLTMALQGPARQPSDRELHGLKGLVKSVCIEAQEPEARSDGTPVSIQTIDFGIDGKETAYTFRWADGAFERTDYGINDGTVESLKFDASGALVARTHYTLDSQGKTLEMAQCAGEGIIERIVNSYDEKGHVKESRVIGADGSVRFRLISSSDPDGRRAETIDYDSDGSVLHKEMVEFDSSGDVIEWNIFDGGGRLINKQTTARDDLGKVVSWEEYKSDGSVGHRQVVFYDRSGAELQAIKYNSDGSIRERVASEYEYDSAGNWTRLLVLKTTSTHGAGSPEAVRVVTRTITYY
jgi:hypothetical protein